MSRIVPTGGPGDHCPSGRAVARLAATMISCCLAAAMASCRRGRGSPEAPDQGRREVVFELGWARVAGSRCTQGSRRRDPAGCNTDRRRRSSWSSRPLRGSRCGTLGQHCREFEKGISVTATSPMVAAVAPDARMTSLIAPTTTWRIHRGALALCVAPTAVFARPAVLATLTVSCTDCSPAATTKRDLRVVGLRPERRVESCPRQSPNCSANFLSSVLGFPDLEIQPLGKSVRRRTTWPGSIVVVPCFVGAAVAAAPAAEDQPADARVTRASAAAVGLTRRDLSLGTPEE